MNVKKYVRYQYKAWISLMVAVTAIVITITVIIGINASPLVNMTWNTETGGDTLPNGLYRYMWNQNPVSMIGPMLFPSLIVAAILPFFAFGHRYGKTRADCYLSLPSKDGQITRIRVLMLGAFLLALYLAAYLFGIGAAIIRQLSIIASAKASAAKDPSIILTTALGNFGWYFLAWPLGAVVVVLFYAMNCFFISQGSNVVQGIIALAAGNLVVSGLIPCALFLTARLNMQASWIKAFGSRGMLLTNGGIDVPVTFFFLVLSNLETGDISSAQYFVTSWLPWVGMGLFLACGVGSICYLLLSKEPGGECAGASGPRNTFAVILPHLAFGIVLTGISLLFSILNGGFSGKLSSEIGLFVILYLTVLAQTVGVYYVLLSLYNHSFKLKKENWISFISVIASSFVLYFVLSSFPV